MYIIKDLRIFPNFSIYELHWPTDERFLMDICEYVVETIIIIIIIIIIIV